MVQPVAADGVARLRQQAKRLGEALGGIGRAKPGCRHDGALRGQPPQRVHLFVKVTVMGDFDIDRDQQGQGVFAHLERLHVPRIWRSSQGP